MNQQILRDNLSPAVHKVCLVFGPSQYGKSTFINNILKFSPIQDKKFAAVGSGNGESKTIKVESYNIGIIPAMFPYLREGYDTFQLIDVPGILDSGLRITKEEIFAQIKRILLQKGIQQLDAILVFESMKDDSRKLKITIEALLKVFGESVRQSIIVLSTKWDRVVDEEYERIESHFENLISVLELAYIKWQNNIKVRGELLLTQEEELKQISLLGAYIKKCQPYCVKEMDSLLLKTKKIAEELRENDPDRYVTEDTEVEIYVPESYTEMMNIPFTEFIPYTENEVEKLAKRIQSVDSGEEVISYKEEEVKETIFIPKTGYTEGSSFLSDLIGFFSPVGGLLASGLGLDDPDMHTITIEEKQITKTRIVPEMKIVQRDLNYYKRFYIGQGKPIKTEKLFPIEKVRFKKSTKIIPFQHERHEFDYYMDMATKIIDEDIRKNLRNKIVE